MQRKSANSKLGGQGSSKQSKTQFSFLPFFYLLAYTAVLNSTYPSMPSTNVVFVIPALISSVFLKHSFLYIPKDNGLCCCSFHFISPLSYGQALSMFICNWQFLTAMRLSHRKSSVQGLSSVQSLVCWEA